MVSQYILGTDTFNEHYDLHKIARTLSIYNLVPYMLRCNFIRDTIQLTVTFRLYCITNTHDTNFEVDTTINFGNTICSIKNRQPDFFKMIIHGTQVLLSQINDLGWQSLPSRRTSLKVTIMYKNYNYLVFIPSYYLIPSNSNTQHQNFTYQLPYSRINSLFFPIYIRLWNSLDYESVNTSSLQQFKII